MTMLKTSDFQTEERQILNPNRVEQSFAKWRSPGDYVQRGETGTCLRQPTLAELREQSRGIKLEGIIPFAKGQ